jgi:hypothetical protein
MRALLVIILVLGAMSIVGGHARRNVLFIREVRRIRSALQEPDTADMGADNKLYSVGGYNAPGKLAPPIPMARKSRRGDYAGPSPWEVKCRSLHFQGPLEFGGNAL